MSSDDFWSRFPSSAFSPQSDPDGDMAERYRRDRGEYPPGSRQRWEADDRERLERTQDFNYDAHPSTRRPSDDPLDPLDDMLMQTITLRARKLRLAIRQDTYLMQSLRLYEEQRVDFLRGQLEEALYVLEAKVLGEDLKKQHVIDTRNVEATTVHVGPATWWDFWKLTYGHRWWARRWVRRHPPRIIDHPQTARWTVAAEFDLEKYRLYPHADIRVRDKLGQDVIMFPVPVAAFSWVKWGAR